MKKIEVELPDIDYLIQLGKENPQILIDIRIELVNKIIQRQETEAQKEKLRNFQCYIDMIEKSSSNKIHFSVKLSELINIKLRELNYVFEEGKPPFKNNNNNIIKFK